MNKYLVQNDEFIKQRPHIMIHGCKEREWYINQYLVPSLVKQGINKHDIIMWIDEENAGCLMSFIESLEWIKQNQNFSIGFWHLQDDVVISKKFCQMIEKYNEGVVCGFCCQIWKAQNRDSCGLQPSSRMWYSFPCIRIPNDIIVEFLDWFWNFGIKTPKGKEWFKAGKFDDSFFYNFMSKVKPNYKVVNLKPNIVDHIDFLLGGSVINKDRKEQIRAYYWNEDDVIKELEKELVGRKRPPIRA